ncbi:MAG: hypothetical protein J6B37_01865 [Clostridia bacterium]|nr:hypothetical protein [Clostridia bacterium]
MDTNSLAGVLGVVSASATAIVLIAITNYVLASIGYMKIAKRREIKNAGLVWVPIARNWTIGAISDNYDEINGIKRRIKVFLVVFSVIKIAISIAAGSYIGMLMPYIIEYGLDLFTYDIGNTMLLIPVAFEVLGFAIACIIYKVCYVIALYKTFESTEIKKSLIFTILSTVLPFASGLFIFLSREKDSFSKNMVIEDRVEIENKEIQ